METSLETQEATRKEGEQQLPSKDSRDWTNGPTEGDKIADNQSESVDCNCCGMSEECTPAYICQIRELYCGKWVCGLCAEAVKEKMKRDPLLTVEEALESLMAFCKQFNKTTRLNPKLSLAGSMRDIARKSFQRRTSKAPLSIARTTSCGPRISNQLHAT